MAKLARARSEAEYNKVARNLKRMYPKMYEAMQRGDTKWEKTPRKKKPAKKLYRTKRTRDISAKLKDAGIDR